MWSVHQQTTRRVVFLDVDGVLSPLAHAPGGSSDLLRVEGAPAPLSSGALRRLRGLLFESQEASIVLSSSWREDGGARRALLQAAASAGIPPRLFVDSTPAFRRPGLSQATKRILEILSWLAANRVDRGLENFVVLDDLALDVECERLEAVLSLPSDLRAGLRRLRAAFVHIDSNDSSLQDHHVQRALEKLDLRPPPGARRQRKCGIVLDIDGTLIDSLHCSELSSGAQLPYVHKDEDGDCIFARPHLHKFLEFCFQHFDSVAIWTASSPEWANTVLRHVLGKDWPWAFVWTGQKCVDKLVTEGWAPTRISTFKPLRKVWRSSARRRAGFSRTTTLIVEDTSNNCIANFGNALIVKTYSVSSDSAMSDDALLTLMPLLENRLAQNDVRTVEPEVCEPELCQVCSGSGSLLDEPCPLCED